MRLAFIVLLTLAIVIAPAHAQEMPNVMQFSCEKLNQLHDIDEQGGDMTAYQFFLTGYAMAYLTMRDDLPREITVKEMAHGIEWHCQMDPKMLVKQAADATAGGSI